MYRSGIGQQLDTIVKTGLASVLFPVTSPARPARAVRPVRVTGGPARPLIDTCKQRKAGLPGPALLTRKAVLSRLD